MCCRKRSSLRKQRGTRETVAIITMGEWLVVYVNTLYSQEFIRLKYNFNHNIFKCGFVFRKYQLFSLSFINKCRFPIHRGDTHQTVKSKTPSHPILIVYCNDSRTIVPTTTSSIAEIWGRENTEGEQLDLKKTMQQPRVSKKVLIPGSKRGW